VRHRRSWWVSVGVAMLLIAGCGASETVDATQSSTPIASAVATTTSTSPISSSTTAVEARILPVPRGTAPVIDGTLEETEWADALVTPVDDDFSLLWLHADGLLYVGIRHTVPGAVNLVVAQGERVKVLHSSAALGSAFYGRREDGTWVMEHDFSWCCRAPGEMDARSALLVEEGWTATIGWTGVAGEVEYQVEVGSGDMWVALSWIGPDGAATVWPADLAGVEREALYGLRSDQEIFVPGSWMLIDLAG